MGVYQIFALLAAFLPGRVFALEGTALGRAPRRAWIAYAAAALVIAAFAGYALLFDRAVTEVRSASTLAALPLHFLYVIGGESSLTVRADQLLLLALCEAGALGALLFHLPALGARERRFTAGAIVAASAAIALTTPAADSGDPYFYVGLGTLGLHAYSPPSVPFGGDLRAINTIWGTPIFASSYGPVWITFSAALMAPLGSLAAKLAAFKVAGFASVLGCAYLARRLGAAPVVVAGIACNPALYLAYVAGAHNDLFGVDLVLVAMLAGRRNIILAFVAALAASLVKPTLAVVAVVAVAKCGSLRVRVGFAALLACCVGAVYAAHGGLIWHALIATTGAFAHPMSAADTVIRDLLVAIALGSAAWTVLSGRIRAQTAWAPAGFGGAALPSYSIWGLPLALASTPVALVYLVSLPVLSFFACTALPMTGLLNAAGQVFVVVVIAAVAIRLRPAPPRAPRLAGGR